MKTINNLVELHEYLKDNLPEDLDIFLTGHDKRKEITDAFSTAVFALHSGIVRVKPESKIIPLDILIDSGIDCEFCDKIDFANVGTAFFFNQIGNNYVTHQGHHYRYCRPRMNHWISLRNVPEDAQHYIAEWLFKYFVCESCASAGFKITGVKEGYRFAWESDK